MVSVAVMGMAVMAMFYIATPSFLITAHWLATCVTAGSVQ